MIPYCLIKKLCATVSLFTFAAVFASAQRLAVSSHHVPQSVADGQAKLAGPLDRGRRLSVSLSLPLRNEAGLDSLLQQIYDPKSPKYHQYLSVNEFTQQFSPLPEEYAAVLSWAQSKGLVVTGTPANHLMVSVEGPVDAIESAFGVKLNNYQDSVQNRIFFAPDREPTLDLSVQLKAIGGLTNVNPPRPHYRKANTLVGSTGERSSSTLTQNATAVPRIAGSGPGNTYLPKDMRAAYYGSGPLTGAGQTVGIVSFDGYLPDDVALYFKSTNTSSSVPIKNVLVGYDGTCVGLSEQDPITCDDGEQVLDIVNVLGVAPGIDQILFYESQSAIAQINQIASDNKAKVISSSWGGGDFGAGTEPGFLEMQAQGQSYLNATGDSGAFTPNSPAAFNPPSADANITQVGGTSLTTNGAGGPWQSETGWAESGGGFDSSVTIPSYQLLPGVINASNQGSTTLRNAPDVAAEADFDNTTVSNGVFEGGFGGTSFATPRWAGIIALANQQSEGNGKGSLGFLNPSIYTLATSPAYATTFHDITLGSNPPLSPGEGFEAVAGYDLVTGWGSPNGSNLIASLTGGTLKPGYFISSSVTAISIAQQTSQTASILVNTVGGFASAVTFQVSGLPLGVTASFSPASSKTGTTMTLTASPVSNVTEATITVIGTSGSFTRTTTIALSVIPGSNSLQLIGNPGFENGQNAVAPWKLSTGVICAPGCGEAPHSGLWYAWFDGYGTTHTDTGSQTVAMPAGKKSASLSFFLHIDTAETTKTAKNDTFTVQLVNSAGTGSITLATFSNLDAASGYKQYNFNLTPYIGQKGSIVFTGKENSSLQTSFVLDDVALYTR